MSSLDGGQQPLNKGRPPEHGSQSGAADCANGNDGGKFSTFSSNGQATATGRHGVPTNVGDADSGVDGQKPKKRKRRRRKRRPVHARVPLDSQAARMDGDSARQAQHSIGQIQVDKTQHPRESKRGRKHQKPTRAAMAPDGGLPQRHLASHSPYIRHQANTNAYAALDLGTNNCRLLVAVPTRPGRFRVIDAYSRIVRLGEGLGSTNRLSDHAMDRAILALKACASKLETRSVRAMRLIATEACRSAENGTSFLKRVRAETGLTLEIADRETEAKLAVSGCASLVERDTRGVVVFDIGGGSSEIALIDRSHRKRKLTDNIVAWTSLPVGVVTMAERFGGQHVTPEIFAAMKSHALQLINNFADSAALDRYLSSDRFVLLGTSGTVTTIAGIHLNLPKYDRRKVDGLWLSDAQVTTINDTLLSWSFEERVANPCIGADRADLVLAGCAILEAIRERWPAKRLRVADRGLREGILTELMAADRAWPSRKRYRNRANHDLAKNHTAPKGGVS